MNEHFNSVKHIGKVSLFLSSIENSWDGATHEILYIFALRISPRVYVYIFTYEFCVKYFFHIGITKKERFFLEGKTSYNRTLTFECQKSNTMKEDVSFYIEFQVTVRKYTIRVSTHIVVLITRIWVSFMPLLVHNIVVIITM